ncbi:MAG TPA: glycosyltransferase family 9 protein [Candidatus Kapabacteria bacterium]|nr:glycosyltransferase family 9 protein [Candidatus Kapabacteria bacterium]
MRPTSELLIPESPSILLLRQDRLGDVLMSTFFLIALHERFPKSRIAMLLGKNNTGVIPLLPVPCETFVYRKRLIPDLKMLREIRREKFDVALDLTDKASVTSSILLSRIRAKVSIGVAKENSVVYDITVPRPSQTEVHITERVAELLRPFGIDPKTVDKRPRLRLNAMRQMGRIGLNVSSRTEDRSAPPAASADIAKGVLELGFSEVLVFAAPHDRARGEETVRLAGDTRVHFAEEMPTFAEFAEQIATCEYLITADTSVIQIAAAAGIPMVLMFRPMYDEHPWTPVGIPFELYTQYPALAALEPQPVLLLFKKLMGTIMNDAG